MTTGEGMRRRLFLTLLGSMAIGCPAEVVAQKPDRVRRVGVLMPGTASSALGLRRVKIFTQALQDLGWTDGQNTRIDFRWPGGDIEQIQSLAKELVGSTPVCSSVSSKRQRQHCSKRPGQSPPSS